MTRKNRRSPKPSTLKDRADQAVEAIRKAPAVAESRVQSLLESSRPAIERAQALASEASRTFTRRAQAVRKDIARRASGLGSRVEAERRNLGKRVDGAVKATLASLNIPTRSEINTLTKRVEELSRKIDSLKKNARKK